MPASSAAITVMSRIMIARVSVSQILRLGVVFIVGLALGVVVFARAAQQERELFAEMLLYRLAEDQEVKANSAERAGDKVASIGHRWAAAELANIKRSGLTPSFLATANLDLWGYLYLTFATWPYPTAREVDPERRGARGLAGLESAKLAQTLQWAGYTAEAEKRWRAAADLMATTVEQLRRDPHLQERARELGIAD